MTTGGNPAVRDVCVVVTARASYARIKTVLEAIKEHPRLRLRLVVAASALLEKYGAAVDVILQDGFEPESVAYMVLEGENLVTSAKSTGLGIVELATLFHQLKPHIVLTVADRYETMATAIAAAYLNITLVHVQGGEITGSIDEKVRHAVTKLADYHFVASERAAERVRRMGEDPRTVFVTGCPSIDLALRVLREHPDGFDPLAHYHGVGRIFDASRGYLVVLQHPVTTECESALQQIEETLNAVETLAYPTFMFWPNVDAGSDLISKGIRHFRETKDLPLVYFLKNMAPEDFLRLLLGAKCLVGNSSVGIREAAFLGIPVVNIGTRQQGRDRGPNVVDVPYDRCAIATAVRAHLSNGSRYAPWTFYGDGRAGERIASLLADVPLTVEKRLAY
jgi:UDP-hydrolysing UDP-N-acetyl-D-glucosamine 2-epimerase